MNNTAMLNILVVDDQSPLKAMTASIIEMLHENLITVDTVGALAPILASEEVAIVVLETTIGTRCGFVIAQELWASHSAKNARLIFKRTANDIHFPLKEAQSMCNVVILPTGASELDLYAALVHAVVEVRQELVRERSMAVHGMARAAHMAGVAPGARLANVAGGTRIDTPFFSPTIDEIDALMTPLANEVCAAKTSKDLAFLPIVTDLARPGTVIQCVKALHWSREKLELLNQIVHGDMAFSPVATSLEHCVHRAMDSVSPELNERSHRANWYAPEAPLFICVDLDMFLRLLKILLRNAARHTPPGGRISILASTESDQVVLVVSDTGVGISPARLLSLFQFDHPLTEEGGSNGNENLGMLLAQRIVRMHDGHISAHSLGTGNGTSIVIRLPLVDPTKKLHLASSSKRPATGGRIPQSQDVGGPHGMSNIGVEKKKGLRILIATSDRDTAHGVATLVRELDHEVDVAYDAPAALGAITVCRPDLALLDLDIAGSEKVELCRAIRDVPAGRHVPIVAMFSCTGEADRIRAHYSGFDAQLCHPFQLSSISQLIAQVMGRTR